MKFGPWQLGDFPSDISDRTSRVWIVKVQVLMCHWYSRGKLCWWFPGKMSSLRMIDHSDEFFLSIIYIYLTILNRPTKQTSLRTDVEMLTSWFNKKIPPIWRRSADGVISKKHVDFAEIQVEYKMKSKGKHQPWIFIKVFMEFHYTMMINNPSNITWWYWILTWILRP
jgi:hypothetical protein